MAEFSVDGRSVATITRFLTLVRALVYDIVGSCGLSAQPHQLAAFHAFDIFIAIAYDAVLRWTLANRTRAVVKFVPLVSVASIFVKVDVNLHSSSLIMAGG
jgi:hypothetical protein